MRRIKQLMPCLGVAMLMWQALPASAQFDGLKGISDPTRPPAALTRKRDGGASDAAAAAEAAASAAAEAAANATGLSAIRYDVTNSEGTALINQQWVKAGEKVNSWHVMSITRDAVVLSGPKGVRRLTLFTDESEDLSKPTRSAKRGRKEKK
jgi:hypothetical protein